MAVYRVEKNKDFTVTSNHHLRNKNLSLKARGLLGMMLSNRDDWVYSLSHLADQCKEGISAVRSGLVELEEAGYVVNVIQDFFVSMNYSYKIIYNKDVKIFYK